MDCIMDLRTSDDSIYGLEKSTGNNMNKNIIYIIVSFAILAFSANWVIQKAKNSFDLPVIKKVPSFSFLTQNGEKFSEQNLIKKATVLDFIFTSCAGPCPMMTSNMKDMYEDYKNVSEVQFVSITVDPLIDNQEILRQYAIAHGVRDDRWKFLTSDLEAIKDLKKNGFMLYADQLPQGHAIKFILIDADGQIRKYYDGTEKASMAVLRNDLNHLVKQIRL
ncbi:MAG: SCO family protein [Candidatus Marinimicrobia bacterium]|nr:SCO family protein [Candidatus Neomarinimicrobiota bacterium]